MAATEASEIETMGEDIINMGRSETELGILENELTGMGQQLYTDQELQELYEKNGLDGWSGSDEERLKKYEEK